MRRSMVAVVAVLVPALFAPAEGAPAGVVVLEDFEKDDWSARWSVTPASAGSIRTDQPLQGSRGLLLKAPGMATLDIQGAKLPTDWTRFEAFSFGIRNVGAKEALIETEITGPRSTGKRDSIPPGETRTLGVELSGLQPDFRSAIQSITVRVASDDGEVVLDMFAVRPAGAADPTIAGVHHVSPAPGQTPQNPPNPQNPQGPAVPPLDAGKVIPQPGTSPPSATPPAPPSGERVDLLTSFEEKLDTDRVWYGRSVGIDYAGENFTHGKRAGKFSIVPGTGFIDIRNFDKIYQSPGRYRSLKFDCFNPNDMEFPVRLQFYRTFHNPPQKGTDIMNVTLFEKTLKPKAYTTVEIPMADALKHESNKPVIGLRIDLPFKISGENPNQRIVFFMDYVRFTLP